MEGKYFRKTMITPVNHQLKTNTKHYGMVNYHLIVFIDWLQPIWYVLFSANSNTYAHFMLKPVIN